MLSLARQSVARFNRTLTFIFLLGIVSAHSVWAADTLVDINSASPTLLADRLPGIGPAKAKAIVYYRELNGPFKSIELLIEVKGIGPATLNKIRPFVFAGEGGTVGQGVAEKEARHRESTNRNSAKGLNINDDLTDGLRTELTDGLAEVMNDEIGNELNEVKSDNAYANVTGDKQLHQMEKRVRTAVRAALRIARRSGSN